MLYEYKDITNYLHFIRNPIRFGSVVTKKYEFLLGMSYDVKEAIANLKYGKSDGEEGLVSDHFINGTMLLQVLITCLFNCMLVHGVYPDTMSCGTI